MREPGLSVDHVAIFRWFQRYAPEINKHDLLCFNQSLQRSPPARFDASCAGSI